ncbi:glucuronate isomerase, partial [Escherichia coli]|nr:glucuronate isomerase [Escherichia coli]
FFDALNVKGELPRTIVFPLNPTEQEAIASTLGNFQQAGIKGKMQLGTAWWFNDHKEGMLRQMNVLANYGVISTFIGMLTDSRSFLSYARHEYF